MRERSTDVLDNEGGRVEWWTHGGGHTEWSHQSDRTSEQRKIRKINIHPALSTRATCLTRLAIVSKQRKTGYSYLR